MIFFCHPIRSLSPTSCCALYTMLRSLASLSPLPLLFTLANAFVPLMNHTICCETAISASAIDHVNFTLNFAQWNEQAGKNDSIPSPIAGYDAWNQLVYKKHNETGQAEYLQFRCGVVYSSANGSESLAAMPVRVPLVWARHTPACIGYEGAQLSDVERWVGPLVGFILPGIVFGLSISSGWALTEVLRASNSGRHKGQSTLRRLLADTLNTTAFLVLSLLEILRCAIIILTCAGPILSSTVQEMYLDHVLLSQLYRPPALDSSTSSTTQLHRRRLLLAILLSNVSNPDGSLATSAKSTILDAPDAQARAYLRILLAANSEFDVAIGTPVAFYTAGYAYALFDAYKRLGDHITSTALTLGLWYMEFALVAVVSGVCLSLFLWPSKILI